MFWRFLPERLANRQTPTGLTAWVFFFSLLILLVQFAIATGLYFRNAGESLSFPYPLEYQEGPALDRVLHLIQNEPVYRKDLSTPPFTLSYDPPVYWLVQVPLAFVFGPAYWYGRALSILCACLAALFIGLSLFTLTHDWTGALIGGLLLLAFPYILHWSALDQADTLALALNWAGIFTVLRRPENMRALALAAVLFTLAIFTRQTYFLAGPLAGVAWLLQKHRARLGFALAGMICGFSLVAFLTINVLTRGGFYYTLFEINRDPFSWKRVTAAFVFYFPNAYFLLVGTLMFLAVERVGDRTVTWELVLPYFFGALVVSMFSGWAGSTPTVFFELSAAFSLAAGAIIVWLKHNAWIRILLILLLAMQIGDLVGWSRAESMPRLQEKTAVRGDLDKLFQRVREAKGMVLVDEYSGMLPLLRDPLTFQPVEFKHLEEQGLWQSKPIIEQVQKKAYPLILLYIPTDNATIMSDRWSVEIRNAIYANYHEVDSLASVYIYVPSP